MELQRLLLSRPQTKRTAIIVSQIKKKLFVPKAKRHQDASISKQTFTIVMNTPSRVFNRSPPLSFEITKHELIFDVRPGFVETTVIPSTQSQC